MNNPNDVAQIIWLMTERNKYGNNHPQRILLQNMIDGMFK